MSSRTAEIEGLAERFLAAVPGYVWDGETLSVPIEDIADSHLGLLIREVEDMASAPGAPPINPGHQLSGLLLPDHCQIWVNASEALQWPGRRRFTIAHEIGHWELHLGAEENVYCRAASIEPSDSTEPPPLPLEEDEANAFAAAVLMPARLVRDAYAEYGSDFFRLCEAFCASGAAMGRRLHAVVPRA